MHTTLSKAFRSAQPHTLIAYLPAFDALPKAASHRAKHMAQVHAPSGQSAAKLGAPKLFDLAKLQSMAVPDLDHANFAFKTGDAIAKFLYDGQLPANPAQCREFVAFCLKNKLPSALSWLVVNADLKMLDLQGCALGRTGFSTLAVWLQTLPFAIGLDLSNTGINYHGVESLVPALTSNVISSLDLSYNVIGKTGKTALSRTLKNNSSLLHLALAKTGYLYDDTSDLLREVTAHPSLASLDISHNQLVASEMEIGGYGMWVGRMLSTNTNLTEFRMHGTAVGPEAICDIAAELASNSTLRVLDVGGNSDHHDRALIKLGEALETNTTLRELHMKRVEYTDYSLNQFAASLASNRTLQSCSISTEYGSHGVVGPEAQVEIAEITATNVEASLRAAGMAILTMAPQTEGFLEQNLGSLIAHHLLAMNAPNRTADLENVISAVTGDAPMKSFDVAQRV